MSIIKINRDSVKYVLGVSAFCNDSAAVILRDGEIIAAAGEERFTRKKHDSVFPEKAIDYCIREAGTTKNDIDLVAFHDDIYKDSVKKNFSLAKNKFFINIT